MRITLIVIDKIETLVEAVEQLRSDLDQRLARRRREMEAIQDIWLSEKEALLDRMRKIEHEVELCERWQESLPMEPPYETPDEEE